MKVPTGSRTRLAVAALSAGALLPTAALAQSAPNPWDAGTWKIGATIYGYFPAVGGQLKFPVDTGGSSLNVDADTLIDGLKFAFMGTLDVHNGRWGFFTDVIYLDVGGSKENTRDFSIGNSGIPVGTTANLDLDLKGIAWTLAGEYRVAADPAWTVDVLAGARMFELKPKLNWAIQGDLGPISGPGRNGTKEIDETVWDGIVGVKGRYNFGADRRWGVPFYADIGTGESDLTWQAAAGVSYAFGWGEVLGMWRYLDYKFKSGKQLEDINFNGPMVGVTFRF